MRDAIRWLLAEPRVPDAPRRVWRDWALLGAIFISAVLESILRTNELWPAVALISCLGLSVTLLYRRTHPMLMIAITLVTVNVLEIASLILNDRRSIGLYTTAYLLIIVYAPFRWGSGRDVRRSLALMAVAWSVSWFSVENTLSDIIGGGVVFLFPAAIGLEVRYYLRSRTQQVESGRLLEREQLARELHDTVAHYVSAIAIQAQAGIAVADIDPDAAKTALHAIEEAASRTLVEMRSMVRTLRDGEAPDLTPQAGIHDIARMVADVAGGPVVQVHLLGELDNVRPVLDSTVYRLAQESITNALRHAKSATRIVVSVDGRPTDVEVTVIDDGASPSSRSAQPGFGVLGMAERVKLLGGTFAAGPGETTGWTVRAVLPRDAARQRESRGSAA